MKNFRLMTLFLLIIAAAFLGIFLLFGLFVFIAIQLGLLADPGTRPWIPYAPLIVTAATISFCLTLFTSRFFFAPVQALINALRQVSAGDFQIQLPEDLKWNEMREMNRNFNRMVKELNSIQLLQSDFIQNVSHEIKTPLAAIEGYAALLSVSQLSAEQKQYVSCILDSSHRLSSLTGNILQLSKLENQQIVPEKKRFLLDEQLRLCILSMEPLWSAKKLKLDLELPETEYLGNEELLTQVWDNLLSNAIKYTPEGGTVAVRLKLQDKSPKDTSIYYGKQKCRNILVVFQDSGIGISEEDQKHIFDKFYQADRSRSSGGNGLGLALVNRILTLCGGQISVESREGEGSSFVVQLPASEPTPSD